MNMKYLASASMAALLVLGINPARAQIASEAQHVINLADVELSALIDDVAMLTGYTFIVHPNVSGRVTVSSQTELSTNDVFQVFLSTLRVQGYTAIPDGRGVYRIVPEELAANDAALQRSNNSSFMTEVFRLSHFSAVEAAKMVKPLLGPQGRVVANPQSDLLIVVEYGSNIGRVRSLIDTIDQDRSVTQTIALQTIPVAEMQDILNKVQFGESADNRSRQNFSAISSPSSNSIILKGELVQVERAVELVKQLDTASALRRDTRVITLSHADATLVEPVLRQLAESGPADPLPGNTPPTLAVHVPSNSIIVSADPEMLLAMETVIDRLDARSRQVLVEAIIVEVTDDTLRELGLQFLVSGTDGDVPFVSSTFSSAAPNLLALTGALSGGDLTGGGDPSSGADVFEQAAIASLLGLQGGTFGFGGQSGETLFGVVLNALEQDGESNVLSTPSIMTLNNNAATISVGQEIPITAGEVLGDANVNPFRTVERREIGVILAVTPRVGEDNTVRLDITQEVSSIAGTVGEITPDFILNQRNLQTSVVVDDGELIVLGGLIETNEQEAVDAVPLLGDIPGLGRLFRSEAVERDTTNLMVFIRPTIIRDNEDAQAVTNRTYDYIRDQQIAASRGGPALLDQYVTDYLGTTPPSPPPTIDGRAPRE